MPQIVYFSSVSENTKRFVEKLDAPSQRIPLHKEDTVLRLSEPFILVTPTYGAGKDSGAVPKQIIRFLNDPENRKNLVGVIGAGNTNFGSAYCLAAEIIAAKCNVPVLYRLEVFGTPEDVTAVKEIMERL